MNSARGERRWPLLQRHWAFQLPATPGTSSASTINSPPLSTPHAPALLSVLCADGPVPPHQGPVTKGITVPILWTRYTELRSLPELGFGCRAHSLLTASFHTSSFVPCSSSK